MRFAVLLVAFASSGALASAPGQPLDCSDWVFLEPGHSCTIAEPPGCVDPQPPNAIRPECLSSDAIAFTAEGSSVFLKRVLLPDGCASGDQRWRTELIVHTSQATSVIAYIDDRCHLYQQLGTTSDGLDLLPRDEGYQIRFDASHGKILIPVRNTCERFDQAGTCYDATMSVAAIEGFATTFEVLQTYSPQASSLGFRVPYMPEGMRAADHFSTFYGPLTKPLNLAAAQPLACNYPSATPAVGDFLAVDDPLPDPAPGTGRYYITAATYQGQTRYGRKTSDGQLSGRDPALLPACAP